MQKPKTTMVNAWTRRQWRSFQTLNSCCSLSYARGHKSIKIFNDLCKPIKICIYARKRHLFASYPAAKHPNAANSGYRHATKTGRLVYCCRAGAHYIPRNNFANLRPGHTVVKNPLQARPNAVECEYLQQSAVTWSACRDCRARQTCSVFAATWSVVVHDMCTLIGRNYRASLRTYTVITVSIS